MRVHIDLETRSTVDLRKTGVYVYAEHPSTQIILCCWAVDDDPVQTWRPQSEPIPFELDLLLNDPGATFCAHNAGFERTMLAPRFPVLADTARWDCTAARAAAVGLPRTLEGAGYALQTPVQKDTDGHRLMMAMCKPARGGGWRESPDDLDRLEAYCVRDVEVERHIDRLIPPLSDFERDVWLLTERMNDRGVLVDGDLLLQVSFLIEAAEASVNATLRTTTGGAVQRVSDHGAITRWLAAVNLDDNLGEDGVGKAALAAMLERTDLDPLARSVLVMRQENGKSSAAKYRAILNRMSGDDRIRGVMVYCGAASTKRWSSRGAQLHNLPRPLLIKKAAKVEAALRDLRAGATLAEFEEIHGPAMVIASELLRPVFWTTPDRWLARGDSKQIEARVGPWLAGAEWKLEAFRRYDAGTGPDLYKIGAAGIYHTSPDLIGDDDPRRQIGKVSELALGFQGGANALQAMAKGYGVKIPRYVHPEGVAFKDRLPAPDGTDEWIKAQWRAANPEIVGLWRVIEDAAVACMASAPGHDVLIGESGAYFRRNSRVLMMVGPSGGRLFYWEPRLIEVRTPWGTSKPTVRYMAEDSQTKRWSPNTAYGGLWFENLVQFTARELMAWWLLQGAAAGLAPVLSVHDEGIFEAPRAQYPEPADAAAAVEAIMRKQPDWSRGLPVSADSSAAVRYLKG